MTGERNFLKFIWGMKYPALQEKSIEKICLVMNMLLKNYTSTQKTRKPS